MSGRHVQSASGGRARIWLAGLALGLAAVLIAAFAGPAGAASKTVNAQLSLSGLASADNPLGGSQIGVRPGDKVSFSAASAPTAGLEKAGLSGLLNTLTGLLATIRVKADFSALPGGSRNTVLSGATTKSFTFAKKGTYKFTWSFESVNILGGIAPLPALDFDGNQLKKLGITLNASNQYVGQIVSATNPPPGGLSVQVPSVGVAPSVPVLGQLPSVSIPGLTLPTLSVSVPDLNPGGNGGGSSGGAGGGKGTGAAPGGGSSAPSYSYAPPGISVPEQVVPGGSGIGGGSGGGGFRLGVAGNGATGSDGQQLSVGGNGSGNGSGGASGSDAQSQGGSGSSKPVDLASSSVSPSSQLPVLLAILAVITLAMVAGVYARLYLLGRKPSSS